MTTAEMDNLQECNKIALRLKMHNKHNSNSALHKDGYKTCLYGTHIVQKHCDICGLEKGQDRLNLLPAVPH